MKMKMKMKMLVSFCVIAFLSWSKFVVAEELLVYSSRNASYIKPLFDDYSRETGVAIRYIIAPGSSLIARLNVEGSSSPADLFITTGAATLWEASSQELLSPVHSKTLERNVPEHLQSSKNDWFAFSKRARTILYNPKKVSKKELSSYEDLAQSKWQGRLCLRSLNNEYSQSLVALLIKNLGEERTSQVLTGWMSNLAIAPLNDDMDIANAIDQGLCDVGIVNSYYFARFKREQPNNTLALFWANQENTGVNMDITGAAVTANSPNKEVAIDFLEWLTTKRTQVMFAKLSLEYPVNTKVYPAREVAKWGKFKEDITPIENLGIYHKDALSLISRNQLP